MEQLNCRSLHRQFGVEGRSFFCSSPMETCRYTCCGPAYFRHVPVSTRVLCVDRPLPPCFDRYCSRLIVLFPLVLTGIVLDKYLLGAFKKKYQEFSGVPFFLLFGIWEFGEVFFFFDLGSFTYNSLLKKSTGEPCFGIGRCRGKIRKEHSKHLFFNNNCWARIFRARVIVRIC